MSGTSDDILRDITLLETELKRLETEYGMYFAGRLKRPPLETRARVENMAKQIDRLPISNYGVRFRFTALQTRLSRFLDLWDRAMRAREEGRPGPFMQPQRTDVEAPPPKVSDRIVSVATIGDPTRDAEKMQELYRGLMEAREQAGQPRIGFDKFAQLVHAQVSAIPDRGSSDVAFRVALKGGKVSFSARVLRGAHRPKPAAGHSDDDGH